MRLASKPWLLIIVMMSGALFLLTFVELLSRFLAMPRPLPYPLFVFIAISDVFVILICLWLMIRARDRSNLSNR
jgi:hypothetical protein